MLVQADLKPLKRQEGYTVQIEYQKDKDAKKTKYLHSLYDPFGEAEKWAEEVFDSKVRVYIIYGIGFLYHIEALIHRIEEEQRSREKRESVFPKVRLILMEPFAEVRKVVRQTEKWNHLRERENVIFIESFDEVLLRKAFNKELTREEIDGLKIAFWTPYRELDLTAEKALMETVRNVKARRLLSSNTLHTFKDSLPENLVKNAKYILYSTKIQELENLFLNRTAIVVSAGPSLEKNIAKLKDFRKRVLIISGGRSVKALLSQGITPHLICSLDPDEENYRLYRDMGLLALEIPMISTWGNYYGIVEEYAGRKIFVNNSGLESLDQEFLGEKLTTVATGFTVASLQMSAAMAMGCDKIIFVGQDMAYDEDGKRYGKETKREVGDDVSSAHLYYVRGNIREKVKTSYDLDAFRLYFEEQISGINHCTFVNATEGGAYIQGTEVMTLQAALEKYAGGEEDFTQVIDERLTIVRDSEKKQRLKENLRRCLKDAKKLEQYGHEALIWAMKITLDFEKNKAVLKKLEQIDKKIESVKDSTDLSNYFIQKELGYVGGTTEEDLDNKEIIEQTRLLYRSIREAGEKMSVLLREELKVLDEF